MRFSEWRMDSSDNLDLTKQKHKQKNDNINGKQSPRYIPTITWIFIKSFSFAIAFTLVNTTIRDDVTLNLIYIGARAVYTISGKACWFVLEC